MSALRLYAPAILCLMLAVEVDVFGPGGRVAYAVRLLALGVSLAVAARERSRRRRARR